MKLHKTTISLKILFFFCLTVTEKYYVNIQYNCCFNWGIVKERNFPWMFFNAYCDSPFKKMTINKTKTDGNIIEYFHYL